MGYMEIKSSPCSTSSAKHTQTISGATGRVGGTVSRIYIQ